MQPKLNPIRLQMLKDISKFSRMDIQNTMNRLVEFVYMDDKLKKQIFKKWFVREISQYIKRLTSLTYKVLPKGDKKIPEILKFFAIFLYSEPSWTNLKFPEINYCDLSFRFTSPLIWCIIYVWKARVGNYAWSDLIGTDFKPLNMKFRP